VSEVLMRLDSFAKAVDTLTPRERDVVKLVADGLSNPQVAERLGLSVKTIENTLARAMRRFDPRVSRGELIKLWTRAQEA
jgi:RNA polymerase sigma factor (sigma-70 family)